MADAFAAGPDTAQRDPCGCFFAVAAEFGLPVLARLPIDPAVAEHFDNGRMESVNTDAMADVLKAVENI